MITSNQNQQFKYLLKLKKSKYRKAYQEALIFGEDIIAAAKHAGVIRSMIVTQEFEDAIVMSDALFDMLADYHMDHKIGALITIKDVEVAPTDALICENIQDPRNLGALFRSALAFGFKHIYVSKDTVDPYHELALRSAKGTTFQLSIHYGHMHDHITSLKKQGYVLVGTSPKPQPTIQRQEGFVALILGNEGQGMSEDTMASCDTLMHIQTMSVESLNVSVAGAICMYELRRQV